MTAIKLAKVQIARVPEGGRACTFGEWLGGLAPSVRVSTASVAWTAGEILGTLRAGAPDMLAEVGVAEGPRWRGVSPEGTLTGPAWQVEGGGKL